jgi:hypothetical protein
MRAWCIFKSSSAFINKPHYEANHHKAPSNIRVRTSNEVPTGSTKSVGTSKAFNHKALNDDFDEVPTVPTYIAPPLENPALSPSQEIGNTDNPFKVQQVHLDILEMSASS